MERFYLSLREVGVIAAFLAIGAVASLLCYAFGTSWSFLWEDIHEDVVNIDEVRFIGEFPLHSDTTAALLQGADLTSRSFPIRIFETSDSADEKQKLFSDQALEGLAQRHVSLPRNLKGLEYGFYVDVPQNALASLEKAFVFNYTMWSPYKMYVNGKLVTDRNGPYALVGGGEILDRTSPTVRLAWIVRNDNPHRIPGLHFRYGLSIRSERAMFRTLFRVPLQTTFPQIASSLCFLIFALIAIGLAISSVGFLDIWAYAGFCGSLALFIWRRTPMFFESFYGHATALVFLDTVMAATSIVSSVALTLSYFRLEGRPLKLKHLASAFTAGSWRSLSDVLVHPFKGVFFSTLLLCAIAVESFWHLSKSVSIQYAEAAVNARLAYIMITMQALALLFGFRSLFKLRRNYVAKRLDAQVKIMNRRIALSVFFSASLLIMLAVYAQGFGTLNLERGSDTILIAAIFPAFAMLLMFFWMVASANRFYMRFAPRLGQIDHEVLAFGEKALEKRYFGVLLVFDLAGMKRLHELRSRGPLAEKAVDAFVASVERDLADLIQKDRVTFRYKSNGDEFIFAMWAKDEDEADRLLVELASLWHESSNELVTRWLKGLGRGLRAAQLPAGSVFELQSRLDMHVLITTMKSMKITVKGGIDKPEASPDFLEPRFTRLTAIFKPSRHNRVAMFADDALRVIEARAQHGPIAFEEEPAFEGMGYLSWPHDPGPSLEKERGESTAAIKEPRLVDAIAEDTELASL